MSKTIIAIVIIVLVLAGGYYAFSMKNSSKDAAELGQNNESVTPVSPAPASSGKKIAFSELVLQGGSYKCDVKQSMSDMNNDGTVYMSGGNIRGDYTTVAEGRTMKTSFLVANGYTYTWSDMMPNMGWKMKVAATPAGDTGADTSGTYSWNASQIGDYNCEPWGADPSTFTVPSNITFQEMKSQ